MTIEYAKEVGILESSPQKPQNTISPVGPKRTDVLLALWKRTLWLNRLMDRLENGKVRPDETTKALVYMCQVHSQLCKTILYGLKDAELDKLAMEIELIKQHTGMIQK